MAANAIMTPLGIAALKSREGVRLKAYLDSVGVPTIGYGHTKGVRLGQVITQAEADAFFLADLESHARPILAGIRVRIADHERDALISIAFNIGVSGFLNSTFLRRLNAGDRAGAAEAILMWNRPPEILSRRQAEYDQFRTPYETSWPRARRGDASPVEGTGARRQAALSARSTARRRLDPRATPASAPSGAEPAHPLVRLWRRLRARFRLPH